MSKTIGEVMSAAKKSRKGDDMGKPGKGFAKIEAKAGGGEKGEKIAGSVFQKMRRAGKL